MDSINVRFSSPPQDSCLLLYDSMEFKLDLIEKSYQLGACVAQLAREYGINDNLLFTWCQRYRHLLPDEIQRTSKRPEKYVAEGLFYS